MSLPSASHLEQMVSRATEIGNDATTTVPQQLADNFQAMLAQANPHAHGVHSVGRENIVTKAVEQQADYYRQVPNDVMYMTQHMSALSIDRLAVADMTIQVEVASLNADLQVKMAAVQSSKDAVQTLMKNQ